MHCCGRRTKEWIYQLERGFSFWCRKCECQGICLKLNVTKRTQCPSMCFSSNEVLSTKPTPFWGDLEIVVKMSPCLGLNFLGLWGEICQVMKLKFNLWEISRFNLSGQSCSPVNHLFGAAISIVIDYLLVSLLWTLDSVFLPEKSTSLFDHAIFLARSCRLGQFLIFLTIK